MSVYRTIGPTLVLAFFFTFMDFLTRKIKLTLEMVVMEHLLVVDVTSAGQLLLETAFSIANCC